MTTSIEHAFGARTMVRGFLLNNQLTDFSFVPSDEEGRPVANRVEPASARGAPWTRPWCSRGTAAGERRLRFVLGSPGGPGIILFNLKTIIALIDWQLDPQPRAALVNFGCTEDALPARAWRASGMRSPTAWRHGP